ncbi:hypothetical protein HPB50_013619 [Hyalomma asiaticum]|uniref:Uncharacterized protein n=1 Tax=Hyalomma asiaticum TaxID=266040 RepID=A0ACB7RLA4_HYAAI|nr:hypothetical protein HPB50_013619 [Hyalomma asiaticum]
MSRKGAKYGTSHVYGKRRKAWNKKRKQHTEANAADLAEQDKPALVEDRESSPACDCDSAPACADYDPTACRVDGACGVEGASSVYDTSTRGVDDYTILLMDATVATGAASIMAVRVLLDHDVPEENIMLVSLLMAESGVHSVAYAFPKVRIITTAVDPVVSEKFYIEPGIGNFGDRYFGTEALEYL